MHFTATDKEMVARAEYLAVIVFNLVDKTERKRYPFRHAFFCRLHCLFQAMTIPFRYQAFEDIQTVGLLWWLVHAWHSIGNDISVPIKENPTVWPGFITCITNYFPLALLFFVDDGFFGTFFFDFLIAIAASWAPLR